MDNAVIAGGYTFFCRGLQTLKREPDGQPSKKVDNASQMRIVMRMLSVAHQSRRKNYGPENNSQRPYRLKNLFTLSKNYCRRIKKEFLFRFSTRRFVFYQAHGFFPGNRENNATALFAVTFS
ncbi:hypothetical protein N5W20_08280 [Candidatus Kirkpatrickella diaphorinae]|uniref:Transposase n=1 Tax=Candidatus Kirkpatrickella diaphorinae TaxID=2984322 RepID=A0ABY6GKA5_9PROT|nr:hypothetical protein [Candidatus Kirkpatrickella diaphorinae]UYH51076.1 hypothetical protein N5W20_08280 [Candidatus Kirkpatrickella diaphorinae]